MTICYLGLGSNLKAPTRQLHQAFRLLRCLPQTSIKKKSQIIYCPASGVRGQPLYANAVIMISTKLHPHLLLKKCQDIEQKQGRIRKKRWGARTLDIDLLLYGHHQINTKKLTLPHPRLTQRVFMIKPLLTLNQNAKLPDGVFMSDYLT